MAGAANVGDKLCNLILELHKKEAVKFGNFTLKSGIQSPVYFDLRVIVSYPKLMKIVAELMWDLVEKDNCHFESICGVPYTALPIATVLSVDHNYPMLIRRKEAKDYGTKKMIEGHYKPGEVCLIVEDVVTSGTSVLETVQTLGDVNIKVTDAVVLMDREQGAKTTLKNKGINVHSVCTLSQVLDVLSSAGKLDQDTVNRTKQFIQQNRFDVPNSSDSSQKKKSQTYKERSSTCTHPLVQQLYKIMHLKKSNLALSVDLQNSQQILQTVDKLGPHLCIVKTHVDIIEDFSPQFTASLRDLAAKHNFLIFEDRKFGDIGKTVKSQYEGGIYKISSWADIVNAHPVPGDGVVKGLKEAVTGTSKGCLLVAEMSSAGSLARNEYTKGAIKMAEDHKDFVIGFICQSRLIDDYNFVHMTPGVKLSEGGDSLGQQYKTPEEAILKKGADVIIVGSGILATDDPVQAAIQYKEAGYKAYEESLKN
ncbi:UMPS [Mytilus edulis]|uniref:Uridine 5'-monophosphate synthase n=2 Tax=Mytilus TaxID=6548 RepID=A0A8S3SZ98_MYTED|nr:UMPS [Mytilus edulis]